MKILMVNKFFYIKGGSETYYFALKRLLEQHHHTVVDFSMKDPKNFPSPYERYFVENIDYNAQQNIANQMKLGLKLIYSQEAKQKLEQLVRKEKPDIAHLHIFQHQLSLSILDVLKKYHIPVVYTAHDLQMLCPNYQMMTHGKICERCKGKRYFNCTRYKCIKDSTAKSLLGTMEAYFNQATKKYDVIDKIITPSQFYRRKFLQFGVRPDRVVHLPNFLDLKQPKIAPNQRGDYYLYFGRLSKEKGILTLIHSAIQTGIRLLIVGTGPLKQELEQILAKKTTHRIELLGFRSGQELFHLVGNAKAVVLPSEWYENGPYSAIESLMLGRPIIGSDIGGIPELIREGENGFLFHHGSKESLAGAIRKMELLTPEEEQMFSDCSRQIYQKYYTGTAHYPKLMAIYQEAIQSKHPPKQKEGYRR